MVSEAIVAIALRPNSILWVRGTEQGHIEGSPDDNFLDESCKPTPRFETALKDFLANQGLSTAEIGLILPPETVRSQRMVIDLPASRQSAEDRVAMGLDVACRQALDADEALIYQQQSRVLTEEGPVPFEPEALTAGAVSLDTVLLSASLRVLAAFDKSIGKAGGTLVTAQAPHLLYPAGTSASGDAPDAEYAVLTVDNETLILSILEGQNLVACASTDGGTDREPADIAAWTKETLATLAASPSRLEVCARPTLRSSLVESFTSHDVTAVLQENDVDDILSAGWHTVQAGQFGVFTPPTVLERPLSFWARTTHWLREHF